MTICLRAAWRFSLAETPLVICGVDSIGLFWDDVVRIRQTVKTKLGRNADVVVAALHDHQAPDTMGLWGPNAATSGINEDYNSFCDRTDCGSGAGGDCQSAPGIHRAGQDASAGVGYFHSRQSSAGCSRRRADSRSQLRARMANRSRL